LSKLTELTHPAKLTSTETTEEPELLLLGKVLLKEERPIWLWNLNSIELRISLLLVRVTLNRPEPSLPKLRRECSGMLTTWSTRLVVE
jgi:hypothetical protein